MADNYLITGYHGEPHVTAENDRGFNAAVFGSGKFVLPVGEMFRAEYIGNNTVRVYDGKLLDGGALAGIPAGKYVDFLIPEAGQGMNRNDLIIFEYSQDASTLIESGVFKVVSGTETSETAVDPVLHEEDLLTDEATLDQMALFRVPVSGAVISDPETLFEIARNLESTESYPNNLLVNSDFSNPVSDGTSGTASYTLPGWTAHNLTITQEQYDIKTVPTTTYAYIKQIVKVTPGKTYTVAARFSNAGVGEIRIYNTAITTQYAKVGKISVVGLVSFTVPDDVNEIAVMLYPNAANVASGIAYWAALYEGEYTAETLPEYHTRGYAMELAVCNGGIGFEESATYPGCYFHTVDGVTEWLNPPMVQGTEYRTVERWAGAVVYTKRINGGTLPSESNKSVSISPATAKKVIESKGFLIHSSGTFELFPLSDTDISFTAAYWVEGTAIKIYSNADGDGFTATFIIKYTK